MSDQEQEAPAEVWPKVVKLKHPVDFGSDRISELTFQRGKLGHLKGIAIDGIPPIDKLLLIGSRLCGQPVAVLELLDPEDGAEVVTNALRFFERCLGGGSAASRS